MGNCCFKLNQNDLYDPGNEVIKTFSKKHEKGKKNISVLELQLDPIVNHGVEPETNNNGNNNISTEVKVKSEDGDHSVWQKSSGKLHQTEESGGLNEAEITTNLEIPEQELELRVTTPGGTEKPPEIIKLKFEPTKPVVMEFEKGREVLINIEECASKHRNIAKFLMSEMEKFGDMFALIDSDSGKSHTYQQVIEKIKTLAAGLQKLGINAGDVICMCTSNNIEYPIIFCAVVLIGGVFQTANPLYTVDDLVRSFSNCLTKYVVVTEDMVSKVTEVKGQVQSLEKIIVVETPPKRKEESNVDVTVMEDVIRYWSLYNKDNVLHPYDIKDPKTALALLLSSSGTTGHPKAVQHSHYSIIAAMLQIRDLYKNAEGSSCLLFLPLFHVYALVIICGATLQLGIKLIIMSRFEPEKYLQLIQDHKVEYLHVVPPVMIMLSKHPKVADYDLSSIKNLISAAAPLSPAVEASVKERLGITNTFQGYGMTEAPVIFSNTEEKMKAGSVGTALPGVRHKIVDVETNATLENGQNGELCIKGPQVTMGYLNNAMATTELFDSDGWMHTGDIGFIDEDGFLFIVDRLKELIKYKGFQVAPAELEDMLLQHPAVMDAAVIGVPNEEAGELPRAFIVKKPNMEITEKEIGQFVDDKVAPHMKLRGGVEFLTQIPKNASGKILRRELKAKTVSNIERDKASIPG